MYMAGAKAFIPVRAIAILEFKHTLSLALDGLEALFIELVPKTKHGFRRPDAGFRILLNWTFLTYEKNHPSVHCRAMNPGA